MKLFREWRGYLEDNVRKTVKENPELIDTPWYKYAIEPIPEP
jgi:hypothetical protein